MTQTEKMEIITLVEQSSDSIKTTLRELGINRSTFYGWYKQYLTHGYDGLALSPLRRQSGWNQLPPSQKSRIIELALEHPALSCRELACYIVDNEGWRSAAAVCLGVNHLSTFKETRFNHYTGLSIDGGCRSLR